MFRLVTIKFYSKVFGRFLIRTMFCTAEMTHSQIVHNLNQEGYSTNVEQSHIVDSVPLPIGGVLTPSGIRWEDD